MNMKKIFFGFVAALAAISLQAQTQEEFLSRYNTLNKNLGPAGVGVETLLDKWEEAYPNDVNMLSARFLYYLNKNQETKIVPKNSDRFLGQKPIVTLKDSLGNPVNYFSETMYDDEQFGLAVKAIDHACEMYPNRLDLRFSKIGALVGYEKESPDMATAALGELIDYDRKFSPKWEYPDVVADREFFDAMVQEYCFALFRIASPRSYEAFRSISEKMLSYEPSNTLFLDNIGSYWLVAKKDNKQAMKYYKKVLKLKPDDITAIQNCIIMARTSHDKKTELRYLPDFIKYSTDTTAVKSAKIRIEYLSGKK